MEPRTMEQRAATGELNKTPDVKAPEIRKDEAALAASGRGAFILQDKVALAELIDRKLELPSIPSMALRVLHCAADEQSSVKDLAKLIEADPALAAWLLRIANSAFYGCSRFVSNVPQAIRLVGMQEVRNLAISVATKKLYKKTSPTEQLLWAGAVGSAVATHLLARRHAPDVRENSFLAGQLHDIGRVLMYNADPQAFAAAEKLANEFGIAQAERTLFGFSHTEVGAVVIHRWKLPEMLETVAGAHHSFLAAGPNVSTRAARLNTCVLVADYLCFRAKIGSFPGTQEVDPLVDRALEALSISKDSLSELQEAFAKALEEARAIMVG